MRLKGGLTVFKVVRGAALLKLGHGQPAVQLLNVPANLVDMDLARIILKKGRLGHSSRRRLLGTVLQHVFELGAEAEVLCLGLVQSVSLTPVLFNYVLLVEKVLDWRLESKQTVGVQIILSLESLCLQWQNVLLNRLSSLLDAASGVISSLEVKWNLRIVSQRLLECLPILGRDVDVLILS